MHIPLTAQEEQFLSRIDDMLRQAQEHYQTKFTLFLDERQQMLAKQLLDRNGTGQYLFYGGRPDACRRMLGIFPPYTTPQQEEFPLQWLQLHYRSQDRIAHRDVLGSLMALQVKRESVGDILVTPGLTAICCTQPVAALVLQELHKIGRVGVKLQAGYPQQLEYTVQFQEIHGVVSAMRLDCVVALLCRVSRQEAQNLIRAGLVQKSFQVVQQNSLPVEVGETITVRGYGKFIVASSGQPTKKGRLPMCGKKYL